MNDEVFPKLEGGFSDGEPAIREKTVIAVLHLAPRLSRANLDECVVMRHFSRLLRDEQPGIRTNTAVCLGKIARHLHYSTRQKVSERTHIFNGPSNLYLANISLKSCSSTRYNDVISLYTVHLLKGPPPGVLRQTA